MFVWFLYVIDWLAYMGVDLGLVSSVFCTALVWVQKYNTLLLFILPRNLCLLVLHAAVIFFQIKVWDWWAKRNLISLVLKLHHQLYICTPLMWISIAVFFFLFYMPSELFYSIGCQKLRIIFVVFYYFHLSLFYIAFGECYFLRKLQVTTSDMRESLGICRTSPLFFMK